MLPHPPQPEKQLVAILDFLGYKTQLWNDDGTIKSDGLNSLYERFFLLNLAKDDSTKFNGVGITDDKKFYKYNEKVNHFIASDTIMLWAKEEKANYLIAAIAKLVLTALGYGIPLRGALAYGDCIFDFLKKIIIGYPIVEAVNAERYQNWIGVGVTDNAAECLKKIWGIVPYIVPMKQKNEEKIVDIKYAVAWHWAEEESNAAEIYIERMSELAPIRDTIKYKNTSMFVKSVIRK
jgi:hypothetical protein